MINLDRATLTLDKATKDIESQSDHLETSKRTTIATALLILTAIGSGVGTYFGMGHLIAYFLYAGGGLTGTAAISAFGTGLGSIYNIKMAESKEISGAELLSIIDKSKPDQIENFYSKASQTIKEKIIKALATQNNYKLSVIKDSPKPTKQQEALFQCIAKEPEFVAKNIYFLNEVLASHIINKMNDSEANNFVCSLNFKMRAFLNPTSISTYILHNEEEVKCKARIHLLFYLFKSVNEVTNKNGYCENDLMAKGEFLNLNVKYKLQEKIKKQPDMIKGINNILTYTSAKH